MITALAALLLTTVEYITPSARGDIDAFIRFMWAAERCPGFVINAHKTLEQIGIRGRAQQWDEERILDKILVEGRIAESLYNKNEEAFCASVNRLYRSYDPAYLRQVGVID
jgi:hypothetical protein